MVFGYLVSPPGIEPWMTLFNRSMGAALLWIQAATISAIKRRDDALSRLIDAKDALVVSLRESEERFRALMNGVQGYAMFMLDAEGRVTSWNAGAERLNGCAHQEIIGRPVSTFYTDGDQAAGKPRIEVDTAIREGRLEVEGWRVRQDGSRFWANVVMTALHDQHGALRGLISVTRDVTERKRAEEVIRSNRARLAGVLESAMDGIISVDESQTIIFFNKAAEEMFRCPAH